MAGLLMCNLYFYPRSPCGERHRYGRSIDVQLVFLSTLSLRRATLDKNGCGRNWLFLSTLSLRRATRQTLLTRLFRGIFLSTLSLRRATQVSVPCATPTKISIHALLAESDTTLTLTAYIAPHFYPRSPCGERPSHTNMPSKIINFYPRSPCGERPRNNAIGISQIDFYPRSPCGERLDKRCQFNGDNGFLSTLSLRRATTAMADPLMCNLYFYPRSPCGERHGGFHKINCQLMVFLSTLSLRRATMQSCRCVPLHLDFYPRSPCGERLVTRSANL